MFLTLPLEIQRNILLSMSWPDISHCLATCRALHSLISSDIAFKYKRELNLAGMTNNPLSSLGIATRLKMLQEQEARWLHLDPKCVFSFQTWGWQSWWDRAFVTIQRSPPTIFIHEVESGPPRTLKTSTIDCPGDFLDQIAVDVTDQDLLVCLVNQDQDDHTLPLELHLFSFSTQEPHPQAAEHILEIDTSDRGTSYNTIGMQICGDLLAVALVHEVDLTEDKAFLYIWNWKTGQQKPKTPITFGSLTFLQSNVVLTPAKGHFDIYYIPPFTQGGDVDETPPQLIASFHLPPFSDPDGERVLDVKVLCLPAPSTDLPPHASSPYNPDPSHSVIMAAIDYTGGVDAMLVIAFLRTYILGCVRTTLSRIQFGITQPPLKFEWNDWGPSNSRIVLRGHLSRRWLSGCRAFGSRLVTSNSASIIAYDFNPTRVRWARNRVQSGEVIRTEFEDSEEASIRCAKNLEVFDQPSICRKGTYSPFRDDVVTSLPCIVSHSWRFGNGKLDVECLELPRDPEFPKWVSNTLAPSGGSGEDDELDEEDFDDEDDGDDEDEDWPTEDGFPIMNTSTLFNVQRPNDVSEGDPPLRVTIFSFADDDETQ